MSNNQRERVASYIRVSSDKQDTQRQKDAITNWSSKTNLQVANKFEDSEGRNSRDQADKRPEFQRLLKLVEQRQLDIIVVERQDRFGTKDAYEWGKFISLLRDNDCELRDADDRVLSSDDEVSILTGTLGAITSKKEQVEKAHRNVGGKIAKARAGEYQGGYPPYGMDVVCFGPDGEEKWRTVYYAHHERQKRYADGRVEEYNGKENAPKKDPNDTLRYRPSVESSRLAHVKEIFDWYTSESISSGKIASRLNRQKVDPIFGPQWNKQKVTALLKNPVYIGLPAWNKRGNSRFVEFSGGQIREVSGNQKCRRRDQAEYVQPDVQEFPPIIPTGQWERTQQKLQESTQKNQRPRRAPNTGELWLRQFLVCGRCGKPMHATRGGGGQRVWPSYFCGTYNTYGKDNHSGCRCHRVHHSLLESIVLDYLTENSPKIAEICASAEGGDFGLSGELLWELLARRSAVGRYDLFVTLCMDKYPELATVKEQIENAETPEKAYDLLHQAIVPMLEQKVTEKENELDEMVAGFADISPAVRDRANERIEAVDLQLKRLNRELAGFRQPYEEARAELERWNTNLERTMKELNHESSGRKKAEALSGVIDRIVLHHRHDQKKPTVGKDGKTYNGRSYLDRVEIFPISGDTKVIDGGALAQD